MKSACVTLVTLLTACGLQEPPRAGHSLAAITGGEVDEGDLAVVSLELTGGGGCSGTLISPRVVLTAAHCPLTAPTFGTVSFGTSLNAPTRRVAVVDSVVHPSSDLRLVKLAIPIGDIVPFHINRVPLTSADVGQPIRHIGFGLDGYPRGIADTKRHVSLTLNSVHDSELYFSSNDGLKGVCFGDSGGPGLMRTGPGTEEVIAGVASYLVEEPACYSVAADVRVDTFASWIDQVTADWEAETCAPTDGCKANCVPVDVDCFCVYDAVCDLRCPSLALDPDCEPECGNDGICSGGVCPFRDPDCVAPGATCTQDSQCQSRTCATQAGKRFCSQGCGPSTQCPASMYCSETNHVCLFRPLLGAGCGATLPCGEGACVDEGDGGQQCRATCESSAGCLPSEQCLAGLNTPGVCRVRPIVTPPPVKKQGCAAVPGDLGLGALLLLFLRRYGSSRRTSKPTVVV